MKMLLPHKRQLFGLFAATLLLSGNPSLAQSDDDPAGDSTRVCSSVFYDPDGDGFGWVPLEYNPHSCVVTEDTHPKPTKATTGDSTRPINAIRPYWDPNVDIANKKIECTQYIWNRTASDYEEDVVFTVQHDGLANIAPYMGQYSMNDWAHETGVGFGVWRSAHGMYFSDPYSISYEDRLNMGASGWAEEIDINGQQGMRFYLYIPPAWEAPSDTIYGDVIQECRDVSGLPFRPTGSWDRAPTVSTLTLPDIPPLNPGPAQEEKPTIINPETGEIIELTSFSWDITNDVLFKRMSCGSYSWTGTPGETGAGTWDIFDFRDSFLFLPPPSANMDGTVKVQFNHRGPVSTYEWSVENGKLVSPSAPLPSNGWYEQLTFDTGTNAVRFWGSESGYGLNRYVCYSDVGLVATGTTADQATQDSIPSDTTADTETAGTETETETADTECVADRCDTEAEDTSSGDNLSDTSMTSVGNTSGGGSITYNFLLLLFLVFVCKHHQRHVSNRLLY